MDALPNIFVALFLASALGARHGFDADHLATIDGLTRFNSGRRIGPWCGCLFSCGHGAVVTAVAVWSSGLAARWTLPGWLDGVGVLISILSLTALGLLNLRAVMLCKEGDMVRPVGFKGRIFGRMQLIRNPFLIMVAGALFALSFDTLALATMFPLASSGLGHREMALGFGLAFTLGMLVTDGINGLWISHLLGKADRTALVASRVMGLAIGALSLLIAAWALFRHLSPAVAARGDGKELFFGGCVIAIVALSYYGAVRVERPEIVRPGI